MEAGFWGQWRILKMSINACYILAQFMVLIPRICARCCFVKTRACILVTSKSKCSARWNHSINKTVHGFMEPMMYTALMVSCTLGQSFGRIVISYRLPFLT
jgi:hypothetical protein